MCLTLLSLAGCGGGGGGGGGGSGTTALNAPNADQLPAIQAVESVSLHYIKVSFNTPADPKVAGNRKNYTVTLSNGNTAPVVDAFTGPGNTFAMLKINPAPGDLALIPGGQLTLDLVNVNDPPVTFTGSVVPEPSLLSAGALSDTRVLLKFSEAMSASADTAANYEIVTNSDGRKLTVTGAVRTDADTGVILTTAPQQDAVYRVVASNLASKAAGIPINPLENERTFLGVSAQTAVGDHPRVAGAISQSNTTVIVTFSKPMSEGAENPLNYAITQDNVNPEVGVLGVVGARFVGADNTAVELTTLSQNEVSYTVTVVNVKDSYGQQLDVVAGTTGIFLANKASFPGTPPGGGEFVDSDGDGLTDNEEQRGWTVTVVLVDGSTVTREVTGSTLYADTDNDGLTDKEELALHTDPRDMDTDDDLLPDAYEFNALFSDPLRQDSDGDSLSDWLEVAFFRTSPLLKDTDGDQIGDDSEIVLATRNPAVADLPQPSIEITSIDLQLDVRFEESSQTGTRDLESRQVSSTLTQSEEKKNSRTNSTADEVSAKLTVGTEFSAGGGADQQFPKWKHSASFEAGYTHNWSSSWTEESTVSTQDQYAKSRNTEAEVTEGSTVTRHVDKASIKAALMLGSLGDIAFNIRNIQITALVPDLRNPGVYLPVATLVPEVPEGSGLENSYTLGPLVAERGPIVFVNREVFPAQVERLMKDPTGVIFKISNYNITDELGRDFAFTSQDIVDRTAPLNLDFGTVDSDGDGRGDGTETYRVATSLGVPVGDVAAAIALEQGKTEAEVRAVYGLPPGDTDSLVAYDLNGKALGVKFQDIMENILGLKHYDEDLVPSANLTPVAQASSYSTQVNNGIERIVRVRQTRNHAPGTPFKRWGTLTPDGLLMGGELSLGPGNVSPNDDRLLPGRGVTLAYVQDVDGDSIPARLEVMHGCRDDDTDSDNDGLDDRLEVFGAHRELAPDGTTWVYRDPAEKWDVNVVARGSYEGFSGCHSIDSDLDGLEDYEEYHGGLFRRMPSSDGMVPVAYAFSTTQGLTGTIENISPPFPVSVLQDPANYRVLANGVLQVPVSAAPIPDSTDPALATGVALGFAAAPSPGAVINILDPGRHWWLEQPGGSFLREGRTDAKNPDTDGDGLTDNEELIGYRIALFFPRDAASACVADTDPGAPANSVVCTSDPLNPDSDGDTLPDGGEVVLRSDPSVDDGEDVLDRDGDGLLGRQESNGWEVVSTWLWDPTEYVPASGYILNADGSHTAPDASSLVVTTRCGSVTDPVATQQASDNGTCHAHENLLVSSDVLRQDTDSDGLNDLQERDLGLHPRDADSDNDGRTDFEEIFGYPKGDGNDNPVLSNPLNYDTDSDQLSDGDELVSYDVGPVIDENGSSQGTYEVNSDPNGESDTDNLTDPEERNRHTDARQNDTDGDSLSDASEVRVGSDPLRADQICVAASFARVVQTNTACDGVIENGAEVLGTMLVNGSSYGVLSKNLAENVEEQIPAGSPVYVLLERNGNSATFTTSNLRECDGNSDFGGADGLGDGAINDGNCLVPATFDNVDYTVTFENYLTGSGEFKTSKVNTFGSGGEQCELEFTVRLQQVTDAVANTAPSVQVFCQGQ